MSQLYKQTLKESMAINRPFQSKIRAAFFKAKIKNNKMCYFKTKRIKDFALICLGDDIRKHLVIKMA